VGRDVGRCDAKGRRITLGIERRPAEQTLQTGQNLLIVSPLLDPDVQIQENQAAIDVRLGRVFSIVKAWTQGVSEEVVRNAPLALTHEPEVETHELDWGQPLIVHPHQFVLARTLEVVRLPDNLLAYTVHPARPARRALVRDWVAS